MVAEIYEGVVLFEPSERNQCLSIMRGTGCGEADQRNIIPNDVTEKMDSGVGRAPVMGLVR
jgi:hypothetical protein